VIARVWLPILLASCIARLWITPLASSFWVDEAETAFIAQHGYSDPSLAIVPQVTASVYYWLPRAAYKIFGFSEIAERLPSLLAMALTLLLIAKLATRLIHPQAGWFAVFACLTLRAFNYEAANARPYALGICVAAASLWLLVRWLDSGRWLDGFLFLASAALLWRVQLIYWPFYFVYAVYFLARSDRRVSRAQGATISAGLVLALLPVIPTALAVNREALLHAFAPQPSLMDVASAFKFRLVAGVAIAAWSFARWRRWPRVDSAPSWSAITLIAGWWAVQPLALFAYSHFTGISVFSTRYLSIALPGMALAATAAAGYFVPKTAWRTSAFAMGIAALIFAGQWDQLWPPHHNSDWRAASQAANALGLGPDTPVLVVSPFIEGRPPLWRPDYPLPGFLYCHLDVYPVTGKPYLLPYDASPVAKRYVESLAASTLPAARRFLIYAGSRDVTVWRDWVASRPEFAQWRSRLLGPFRDVDVALFEAPDSGR
jgi:4-amino-4-deoxy-L-arabinose transferase-like glycosyltransferase